MHPHKLQQYAKQICELLGVEGDNFNDDVLKEVDLQIEALGCTVVSHDRVGTRTASGEDLPDKGVCDLLDKIDKFG